MQLGKQVAHMNRLERMVFEDAVPSVSQVAWSVPVTLVIM